MQNHVDLTALAERTFMLRTAPARASSRVLRRYWQRKLEGTTRVHLGCGPYVFDGWANLDVGGGDGVVPYDLTGRLPFPDGSLDQVFTEHFIEHVSRARGVRFLAECARILRPDGVLRVSTPDLRRLVDGDQLGRTTEWEDQGWEPQTPARLIKEGYTFPYDENELSAALGEAGFSRMKRVGWHESEHADLRDLERRSLHGDLILEASR